MSPSNIHFDIYECETENQAKNLLSESLRKKSLIDSLDQIFGIDEIDIKNRELQSLR